MRGKKCIDPQWWRKQLRPSQNERSQHISGRYSAEARWWLMEIGWNKLKLRGQTERWAISWKTPKMNGSRISGMEGVDWVMVLKAEGAKESFIQTGDPCLPDLLNFTGQITQHQESSPLIGSVRFALGRPWGNDPGVLCLEIPQGVICSLSGQLQRGCPLGKHLSAYKDAQTTFCCFIFKIRRYL